MIAMCVYGHTHAHVGRDLWCSPKKVTENYMGTFKKRRYISTRSDNKTQTGHEWSKKVCRIQLQKHPT